MSLQQPHNHYFGYFSQSYYFSFGYFAYPKLYGLGGLSAH